LRTGHPRAHNADHHRHDDGNNYRRGNKDAAAATTATLVNLPKAFAAIGSKRFPQGQQIPPF
jgi:hypothetical protein